MAGPASHPAAGAGSPQAVATSAAKAGGHPPAIGWAIIGAWAEGRITGAAGAGR